jgi:hypothetical protein
MSVFANGMEISSKSMSGKTICEFPDVCMTPPQTPATPPGVPIPYPNTAMASDTSDGSKSVSIQGEEVMLKNQSFFKTSTGDEAGAAPKKGLMSSTNKGKAYFIAWSMDVKFEGENVVRHLDMTTHNHASDPATGAAPAPHVASMAKALGDSSKTCAKDAKKVKDKCKKKKEDCPGHLGSPVTDQRALYESSANMPSRTEQAGVQATADADANECTKALRCHLRPYDAEHKNGGCCPGQTPHHVPPKSMMSKVPGYSMGAALCVCMEGASQHVGSHGENHAALDHLAAKAGYGPCTVKEYNNLCATAVAQQCGCKKECIEDQLNNSFTEKQQNTQVTHWQSNSKQLSPELKTKLDRAFKLPGAIGEE